MNFKPNEFFIGLVEFISILLLKINLIQIIPLVQKYGDRVDKENLHTRMAVNIPVGNGFQFWNTGKEDLNNLNI